MSKVHIISTWNHDHGSKLTNWVCDEIVKASGSDIIQGVLYEN